MRPIMRPSKIFFPRFSSFSKILLTKTLNFQIFKPAELITLPLPSYRYHKTDDNQQGQRAENYS